VTNPTDPPSDPASAAIRAREARFRLAETLKTARAQLTPGALVHRAQKRAVDAAAETIIASGSRLTRLVVRNRGSLLRVAAGLALLLVMKPVITALKPDKDIEDES
jgi:hypothetical protein